MLYFCIGGVLLGAILRLNGHFRPLDILCFLAGGFFGLCFLLQKINEAVWKIVRKPIYILLALFLIAALVTLAFIHFGVKDQKNVECDYLIVLGCKVKPDEPSKVLSDRINAAYDYLIAHPNTVCIASGGQGADEPMSEAQCIFDELTAKGIAPERILLEERSTSTSENFRFSMELIDREDATIGVLTSEFHLYRASLMAKKSGLDAIFVSARTSTTSSRIGYTVREIFALWKYLLMGE